MNMDWMNAPHSMGTTIIRVTYNGGVVLKVDSRTGTEMYVANRASDKITQLADNVYLCRSGSAADSQVVSDYVRYFLHQHIIQLGQPAKISFIFPDEKPPGELCHTAKIPGEAQVITSIYHFNQYITTILLKMCKGYIIYIYQ